MERTLAIIKPDAVKGGHSGKILDRILQEGFAVRAMKLVTLTKAQAEGFYAVHAERPFFGELTEFMSSGPCIPLVLEREDAVAKWREVIGATNPAEAAEGTIRKQFATSMGENAVHGSDSAANGVKEGRYFFPESEIVQNGADVIDA
ncbi:MAG TPA: nucleoside-diphosphate kinase [Bacteroidetes bacterium]|nr:nucleoside-diphosphate kinase [Bacteroidota bacterium]